MNDVRKGVFILPNLFTSASLFCGFYAIIHAIKVAMLHSEDYRACAWAIVAAAFLDGMDGRVARKTNTESRFGMEYDSLSDLVSFGVAPAVLVHLWALSDFGRVGWLAAGLYLACGALRLARFNVQSSNVEKRFFQGLPIPMAAMMIAGSVLIWEGMSIRRATLIFFDDTQIYLLGLTYLLAGLMVCNIPYRSFKTLRLTHRHPFYYLVLLVVGLTFWATKPWWILYLAGCIYLLSGPIERYLLPSPVRAYKKVQTHRQKRKSQKLAAPASVEEDSDNVHNLHTP